MTDYTASLHSGLRRQLKDFMQPYTAADFMQPYTAADFTAADFMQPYHWYLSRSREILWLKLRGNVGGQTVTMRATVAVQLMSLFKFVKLNHKNISLNSEQLDFLKFTCW